MTGAGRLHGRSSPISTTFARAFEAGRAQVVSTSLVADLETPVSAMLKLADGRPYSFLLESVTGGAVRGRYSILGIKPDLVWRCRGDAAEINRAARSDLDAFEPCAEPALDSLRQLIAESRIELPDGLPLMAAGLFGHMAYDMVRLIERLPDANPDRLGLPDAVFLRPTVVALFDHIEDRITVVTPVWPSPELRRAQAYDLACERLADAVAEFNRGSATSRARWRARRPSRCERHPRAIPCDGRAGEGVHPRRRHLPGGALAAVRAAVPPAAVRALPRAAPAQPLAVPVLPRPRRLRAGGLEPGDPGARCATAR